jgi:hypothetical protein
MPSHSISDDEESAFFGLQHGILGNDIGYIILIMRAVATYIGALGYVETVALK